MAESLRVGVIGGGWPGTAHARGYQQAGGFKIVAISDLIPDRRKTFMNEFGATKEFADAKDLLAEKEIDVVSVCLPNHLHAAIAIAALRAGKHACCELPVAMNAKEARQIAAAAEKNGKSLLYAAPRRFGAAEQAASQALAKGYAGDPYHARAAWNRSRAIPVGTGWFSDKSKSGGGALIDLGVHMLDLAWHLLGHPKPQSAFAVSQQRFKDLAAPNVPYDVEDAAFALLKFEGGKSLELSASWALNQPPHQQGAVCRVYASKGALDVYTPQGATIYRKFDDKGDAEATPLKPPKTLGHVALMKHFKDCIHGKEKPLLGGPEGVQLMAMIDALYKSAETGKSVEVKP